MTTPSRQEESNLKGSTETHFFKSAKLTPAVNFPEAKRKVEDPEKGLLELDKAKETW